ncbi:MAG: pantoate--beta-alanine ligase [Chitinophagales bacterium]|nr:pantoate--beta-alanine ligase [Chitinophagales bacterium]
MLLTITRASELTKHIQNLKLQGLKVGFIPTMGALHEGHLKLIKTAKRENDVTVVSIFVNPTQFNDKKDLEKYPRTLAQDQQQLAAVGTDILFAPEVEDIYPSGTEVGADIYLGGLDAVMEGTHRPGHFNGVAQVVKRLLDIVQPDQLYMGQKDFQQFTIINYMLKSLQIPVKLRICPIVREKNGLAMSSRNVRLSAEAREQAKVIFNTLKSVKQKSKTMAPEQLTAYAMKRLNKPPFTPEYFDIVDGDTLNPVVNMDQHSYVVACTAVWVEGVRLIDNMILKG